MTIFLNGFCQGWHLARSARSLVRGTVVRGTLICTNVLSANVGTWYQVRHSSELRVASQEPDDRQTRLIVADSSRYLSAGRLALGV